MNYIRRCVELVFVVMVVMVLSTMVVASTTKQWVELGKVILALCTVAGAFSAFFRVTNYFDPHKDKDDA